MTISIFTLGLAKFKSRSPRGWTSSLAGKPGQCVSLSPALQALRLLRVAISLPL
jgi:hypothetical protein